MPGPLAQKIRAKFPGVYDDMDDAALERAVLAKHPEYADLVEPEPKDEKTVGGFLSNIPKSAGKFVKDTWEGANSAVNMLSPVTMAKSVARAAQDPVGESQRVLGFLKAAPGAIKQGVMDRYGSLEAAGNTLYEDPVGVLSDVSTVAGIGAATKAPKLAGTLSKIEAATNPLRAVTVPATKVANKVGPALQNVAVSEYERMLKPNRSTLKGMTGMGSSLQERSKNVSKALIADPNGQISKRGANRYADATEAIQQQVDDLVDANPDARGSTRHLTEAMEGGRGKFESQWAPGGDTSAYDTVTKEVLNNPRVTKHKRSRIDTSVEQQLGLAPDASEVKVTGRELIPRVRATTARELTQGTYRTLGDKAYGELKGAQTEAQKAAARGGRGILNEAIPEVEPLNRQIQQRIDLGDVLDEAVFRSGKHDPIGLGERVIIGGGNYSMLPVSLINRPGVGSAVARGLYRGGGALAGAGIDPALLRAALLARLVGGSEDEP